MWTKRGGGGGGKQESQNNGMLPEVWLLVKM